MKKTLRDSRNELIFDNAYYANVYDYLTKRSISTNRIVIPMKAVPGRDRFIIRFFLQCKLEKGTDRTRLKWHAFLFPLEALAVFFLLLLILAAVVFSLWRGSVFGLMQILFFGLLFMFAALISLNYAWQYKKCVNLFKEDVEQTIATQGTVPCVVRWASMGMDMPV